ncbi:Putative rhamnosyl transferase [Poseidonocella pacifica]|uniref:Putative rhamnosyl transferase n=1 Tax=Poseidonocella pacifica TaxID=871651 RepID=A0A1I0WMG4_9RHOB|nr:glycosyltransferase [Poseidonocella pacifica]SFA89811.1 Putative rhamnosyl transferase [Poseidonocella pacifica]
MIPDDLQVLGLCRWSYPSELRAFNHDFPTLDALRAYLYDPARLALRLFFFEHLIMPCLRAQTDDRFTLLLMLGDQLPDPARTRLLELAAQVPQIRPVFVAEGRNHRRMVRRLMVSARDPSVAAVAEFRLDDDDAIAGSFVAQVRSIAALLGPVHARNGRLAVDFCKGLVMRADRPELSFSPALARLWTPALALVLRPDDPGSLLDYPHMRVWKQMPTLSMEHQPMFIRGAHGGNDSALSERSQNLSGYAFDRAGLPDLLRDDFGINHEGLLSSWRSFCRGRDSVLPFS